GRVPESRSVRPSRGGGKGLPAKASDSPASGNPPLTPRLLMSKGVTTEAACLDMRQIRHWIYPHEELWLPRGVGKVHVFERSLLILLANGRHTGVRYTSTP